MAESRLIRSQLLAPSDSWAHTEALRNSGYSAHHRRGGAALRRNPFLSNDFLALENEYLVQRVMHAKNEMIASGVMAPRLRSIERTLESSTEMIMKLKDDLARRRILGSQPVPVSTGSASKHSLFFYSDEMRNFRPSGSSIRRSRSPQRTTMRRSLSPSDSVLRGSTSPSRIIYAAYSPQRRVTGSPSAIEGRLGLSSSIQRSSLLVENQTAPRELRGTARSERAARRNRASRRRGENSESQVLKSDVIETKSIVASEPNGDAQDEAPPSVSQEARIETPQIANEAESGAKGPVAHPQKENKGDPEKDETKTDAKKDQGERTRSIEQLLQSNKEDLEKVLKENEERKSSTLTTFH